MSKKFHCLLLLLILAGFSGCTNTIHGVGEDIHDASNPDLNGWNSLVKMDAWMRENLW